MFDDVTKRFLLAAVVRSEGSSLRYDFFGDNEEEDEEEGLRVLREYGVAIKRECVPEDMTYKGIRAVKFGNVVVVDGDVFTSGKEEISEFVSLSDLDISWEEFNWDDMKKIDVRVIDYLHKMQLWNIFDRMVSTSGCISYREATTMKFAIDEMVKKMNNFKISVKSLTERMVNYIGKTFGVIHIANIRKGAEYFILELKIKECDIRIKIQFTSSIIFSINYKKGDVSSWELFEKVLPRDMSQLNQSFLTGQLSFMDNLLNILAKHTEFVVSEYNKKNPKKDDKKDKKDKKEEQVEEVEEVPTDDDEEYEERS